MSDTDFFDWQVLDSPAWIQESKEGRRFEFVLGIVKQAFNEACKQAVKSRHPKIAPVDALDIIGRDRGIDRGFFFTINRYREQLVNAFAYWRAQGTAEGLRQALIDGGYPNVEIIENFTGNGIPVAEWSWFYIVFSPPYPWPTEGVASWSDDAVWDDDAPFIEPVPTVEADRIRAIVKKLKPSHAKCAGAQFSIAPQLWGDPERIWGNGLVWSGLVAQIDV